MSQSVANLQSQAEQAYARGDLQLTKQLCNLILSGKRTDVDATVLLGVTLSRMGQTQVAIAYLQNALRCDPKSFDAHVAMSTILFENKCVPDALRHCQSAIEASPEDPDGHTHLGLILKKMGRMPEATKAFLRAVQLAPNSIRAAQNLAAAFQNSGHVQESIATWMRVTELSPAHETAWFSIAQLNLSLGNFEEAIHAARKLVGLHTESSRNHLLLALALSESGRGEEAEFHLRKAIQLDPSNGLAQAALGFWLQEQGDFSGSMVTLEKAISLIPSHGFAYYNLYRCKKASSADLDQLQAMESITKSGNLNGRDFSYLNYALGKAYEDLGEFERAIGFFDQGNKAAFDGWLRHKPWDLLGYAKQQTAMMALFDKSTLEQLGKSGEPSEAPIFIVGMMRSGTSLMEQILSSHPDVSGGGELTFWHEACDQVLDAERTMVDVQALQVAGARYVEKLATLADGKRRVTDKLPHNYALIGLIHAAFPKAKFVHVKRNPVDNCLSIYTTAYQRPPVFGHVRENIVSAYREYERLMEHWRAVLPPEAIIDVQYESLISDTDEVTREVVSRCGLPWSDACLEHQKNERSVRTPSLWQVRQPIYRSSVNRWRQYGAWIEPFNELDPAPSVSH